VERRIDHHELGRNPSRLGQEARAVVVFEMSVEMAREHTLERIVVKRQCGPVALDDLDVSTRKREHSRALVESDDLTREVSRQEACAAGHVERPLRRQYPKEVHKLVAFLFPVVRRSCVETLGQPPVVVLRGARVVVGLHAPTVRPVLEAVPNFSEGRDAEVVEALRAALSAPARLLDVHVDPDHHRSVFTLVGEAGDLVETLLVGIACARERIDLRRHEGAHPRIGAADVVPIVPIRPEQMSEARNAALVLAQRIGDELGLPVFLYGELAPGRGPAFFRRGGPKELDRRIAAGELEPDFGPLELDPRAGGVIVGARRPLIAFNVNLRGGLVAAREIAALVRETGGGFPGVRALGLDLPRAGVVQVSMNVEDFEAAALHEIVARVELEALERGAEVLGSELIGLMPAGAAAAAAGAMLRIDGFDESHVLELRLLS